MQPWERGTQASFLIKNVKSVSAYGPKHCFSSDLIFRCLAYCYLKGYFRFFACKTSVCTNLVEWPNTIMSLKKKEKKTSVKSQNLKCILGNKIMMIQKHELISVMFCCWWCWCFILGQFFLVLFWRLHPYVSCFVLHFLSLCFLSSFVIALVILGPEKLLFSLLSLPLCLCTLLDIDCLSWTAFRVWPLPTSCKPFVSLIL